ncbi:S9 family peptidase [Flavihumibacter solisilvae]|uniref:Peptidase S9 prolyl oligopeptidase n=1 Tax=Flavihumibacter solisilvae TaxID=1349421 RepID=A0A0C1L711_9BACT|nr:S9 family peptidase [Flavihumibacter solisilvae]KIC95301.1 peptidase S9 prolyl oligopeptidase [Flavihumibacter solisilvae]
MKYFLSVMLLVCGVQLFAQKNASISFEQWISLKGVGSPQISPDGKTIIYTVGTTDWANNSYDSEIWMVRNGEPAVQLTRTAKGSSMAARFTPDNRFVSFLADRGDKTQLYIIPVNGGEAFQVTKDDEGIGSYEWNNDGTQVVYTRQELESKLEKTTKERFGAFSVDGEEYRLSHLWILNFNLDSVLLAGQLPCYPKPDSAAKDSSKARLYECYKLPVAKKLTEGNFTVNGFAWSPDGKKILFNSQRNPMILSGSSSDIVVIDVKTKKTDTLVKNPTGDFFGRWNTDGTAFTYSSAVNDSVSNYYKNNRLFIYELSTRSSREIATDIDENKYVADWNRQGLFVTALEKTKQKLYSVDPKTGRVKIVNMPYDLIGSVAFSRNTDRVVVSARNYSGLNEIYEGTMNQPLKKVTNNSAQIAGWNTPLNEVIEWKSSDGSSIEGVLSKPKNFTAGKRYPLLVVIHGGPTGIDIPDPATGYVYPLIQWVEKGALVLRVNYRGSAGYGEKFRSLNVRNLGVGDMWDVVSGVEYLDKQGMIDTARMGVMGWSQGGYISAFLATNTTMFKAISVGAGISNWVTYYVNTDITPFTRQYLQATPWNDMEIYLKTSPMTNINKASTPTLIQHGEFDKRVPIPNAYELYRGLQDRNVPSKLIVYKGFGHGINKPKERLAAIWHNWQWFNKYVFNDKDESMPLE